MVLGIHVVPTTEEPQVLGPTLFREGLEGGKLGKEKVGREMDQSIGGWWPRSPGSTLAPLSRVTEPSP